MSIVGASEILENLNIKNCDCYKLNTSFVSTSFVNGGGETEQIVCQDINYLIDLLAVKITYNDKIEPIDPEKIILDLTIVKYITKQLELIESIFSTLSKWIILRLKVSIRTSPRAAELIIPPMPVRKAFVKPNDIIDYINELFYFNNRLNIHPLLGPNETHFIFPLIKHIKWENSEKNNLLILESLKPVETYLCEICTMLNDMFESIVYKSLPL